MRLCLNMIVKNEAARIERALASVAPYISSYCILDTGSTDGTQELIERYFSAHPGRIPGKIHRGQFENFEQARNDALQFARFMGDWDYLLLMDADMELVVDAPNVFSDISGPSFDMMQRAGTLVYANRRLLSAKALGQYRGVTHEYLDVPSAGLIQGAHFIDHADGSNRVDKFKRDIDLLIAALIREPTNERYWFYLAQSYRDAGDYPRAAQAYKKRASMGGFEEEAWNAQVNYGSALRNMGDVGGFVHETLSAYNRRPQRAEPLYDIAKFYREAGNNAAAVIFAEAGMKVPFPKDDQLFVDEFTYSHGLKNEFSIAAFYDPRKREAGFKVCDELAVGPGVPAHVRDLARTNLFYYIEPLSFLAPSFKAKRIHFCLMDDPDGWVAMNPSVCVHNGDLFTTIRTVNYKISHEGRYQIRGNDMGELSPENPIRTRNYLASMDSALNLFSVEEIHPAPYTPLFGSVLGYEDMRLFSFEGELMFSTCVRDMNAEGWCEQAVGLVSDGHAKVIRPNKPQVHEKNWMPFPVGNSLKFVYQLGQIIDLEGEIGIASPTIEGLRGSSQVIPHQSGWLAIVHEARVKPDGQRYYNHRFVWMDIRGRLRKVSRPFYLHDKQIEFVAGLAKNPYDGNFVISYGVRDCEAWVATVNSNEIEWVLWHD